MVVFDLAAFAWLTAAPHLYYWGDIDAHGYEILDGWHEDGVHATSILMEPATYDTYARSGTNTDQNGNPHTVNDHTDTSGDRSAVRSTVLSVSTWFASQ